jgi:6-phosphogluconolactonase
MRSLRIATFAFTTLVLALTGCGNFFVYPGTSTSTATTCTAATTTTGTGTNFGYVSNSSCGSTYLNGYALSGGTLVPAVGSPYSLGFVPQAMAVTPNNSYLFIASDSALNNNQGYIYGYTIGTGGVLTILNSGSALQAENTSSLAISPDGQWLFSLNTNGTTLEEYQISGGTLTAGPVYAYAGAASGVVTPSAITVAPSADFVVLSLGTAGMITFPFNTTTGALSSTDSLYTPSSSTVGIYSATVDISNNIYVASTSGLLTFSATTSGALTLTGTGAAGSGPHTIVLNSGYTFDYIGNQADSTITGFPRVSGTATAISGSPFSAPTDISALGRDSSGTYLLAGGYNSTKGIELYSISSTSGALTSLASTGSGTSTSIPVAIALTH